MTARLEPGQELRFETARTAPSSGDSSGARADVLRVLSGSAELFGCELFPGHDYPLLPGRSYGVFSWLGCEVQLDASFCSNQYTSDETPMAQVAKVHRNLEIWRQRAATSGAEPPRVAVVGSANSGKSTLAQILAAYAVRAGRRVALVDVDSSKNSICVPGSVAATVLDAPEDLFSESGDVGFTPKQPLSFFVGTETVTANTSRYKEQVGHLAARLDARLGQDPKLRAAGAVVDTFAWSSSMSVSKTLDAALKLLKVNVILIIGNDRLLSEMKNKFPDVRVVKVERSGGVAESETGTLTRRAAERMRWYFEGLRGQLSPVRLVVKLGEDVTIYLIKGRVIADDSIRPIGMDTSNEKQEVPRLKTLDASLASHILAVSHATSEEEVLTAPVAGFCHVEEVDVEAQSITLLVPCPGKLPTKSLLLGKVKMFETR